MMPRGSDEDDDEIFRHTARAIKPAPHDEAQLEGCCWASLLAMGRAFTARVRADGRTITTMNFRAQASVAPERPPARASWRRQGHCRR